IDTYGYGKALTIDNMFMCTEKDEAHYHEMISHPAMLAHGNVKKVLIIGGGDGASVREVCRHKEVEKVIMVEIDGNVVEACKKHLPQMAAAFDDPRVELIIGDGISYVANAPKGSFDYIIVDGSDPVGPAEGLFSKKFYTDCKNALSEGGILITQGESPLFNAKTFAELNACLKTIFDPAQVRTMLFHIPTYPSGIWSFQTAVKGSLDIAHPNEKAVADFEHTHLLKYYNSEVHRAAFALPNYVKKMLNE
ncbi:MAG: polyamine aminopropyltransferase, partial [Flavobacteriales bacterium]|nr:polyamine aminopropyltransferase [Flavobacteriales bacterium]